MKHSFYLNCEPLPETVEPGGILTVQISPIGEWPHGEVMQHVTENAVAEMLANWERNGSRKILESRQRLNQPLYGRSGALGSPLSIPIRAMP